MMAITRAEGKNCTDSTVDNNHALHAHEALHGVTAIKFYVNSFCLGFGGPSALGALGCSPFSPLGNPGLLSDELRTSTTQSVLRKEVSRRRVPDE